MLPSVRPASPSPGDPFSSPQTAQFPTPSNHLPAISSYGSGVLPRQLSSASSAPPHPHVTSACWLCSCASTAVCRPMVPSRPTRPGRPTGCPQLSKAGGPSLFSAAPRHAFCPRWSLKLVTWEPPRPSLLRRSPSPVLTQTSLLPRPSCFSCGLSVHGLPRKAPLRRVCGQPLLICCCPVLFLSSSWGCTCCVFFSTMSAVAQEGGEVNAPAFFLRSVCKRLPSRLRPREASLSYNDTEIGPGVFLN